MPSNSNVDIDALPPHKEAEPPRTTFPGRTWERAKIAVAVTGKANLSIYSLLLE